MDLVELGERIEADHKARGWSPTKELRNPAQVGREIETLENGRVAEIGF